MKRILSIGLIFVFASTVFAQQTSTNPGVFPGGSPSLTQSLIKCPKITISTTNGGTTYTKTLDSNPANATVETLGAACNTFNGSYVSGGGWGGGVIAAGIVPSCAADHPYLGGFTEVWAGSFLTVGSVSMSGIICCTQPQPPMSFTSGETEWVVGTSCP